MRSSAARASCKFTRSSWRPFAARSRFICAMTASSIDDRAPSTRSVLREVRVSAKRDSGAARPSATTRDVSFFIFMGFLESCGFGRRIQSQAMCLIAIAHLASDRWPLVIAANRDEFFARPTRAAHWWDDAPDVLGGRDLRAGGSWMAVTRGGRFAMVTNVRGSGPAEAAPYTPSRGLLVADFVRSSTPSLEFAEHV